MQQGGIVRQSQTILNDSSPVRNAMIAVERQGVIFESGLEDEWNVQDHTFGYFASAFT